MKYNSEHIKSLCDELLGLGITVDTETMKSIIKMQEDDFIAITKELDPDLEYRKIIQRIKNGHTSQ